MHFIKIHSIWWIQDFLKDYSLMTIGEGKRTSLSSCVQYMKKVLWEYVMDEGSVRETCFVCVGERDWLSEAICDVAPLL